MAFFVSYFSTVQAVQDISIFEDGLPYDPLFLKPSLKTYTGKNNQLFVWSYVQNIDRPILLRGEDAVWAEGYAPEDEVSLEERIVGLLENTREDTCGSFCGIWHQPDSIRIYTSLSGNFSLYVYKTDFFTAISNRINLLAVLGSLSIRPIWPIYLTGARRALDFGTAFEDITTTKPGEAIYIQPEGITYTKPKLKHLFQSMDVQQALEELYAFPEYLGKCLSQYSSVPLHLALTGGRDSRAVLSMLDKLGLMDIPGKVHTSTNNLKHDAEYLSAQSILDIFTHYIPHDNGKDFFCDNDVISAAIETVFSQGFCLDFASTGISKKVNPTNGFKSKIVLGGTDYDYKVFKPQKSIHAYIQEPRFVLTKCPLIRQEVHECGMQLYRNLLADLLGDLPEKYYLQLDVWWIPLSRGYSNSGRGLTLSVFPFIDTAFLKFFFSAPIDFFTTQAAYYLLMRQAKRPLWKAPFCDIEWPISLPLFLHKHKLPAENLDVVPYHFNPGSPGQSQRGRKEWLDILVNKTQKYMRDKVKEHKELFSFVSQEGLDEVTLKPAEQISFSNECYASGLLCSVFLAEYGQKLLQRSQIQGIQEELIDCINGPKGFVSGVDFEQDTSLAWMSKYENCLASTVEELYQVTNKFRYEWLKDYPDLLSKMGFIKIHEGRPSCKFNTKGAQYFSLRSFLLGPSASPHRPSPMPINPPLLLVFSDIKATFVDLEPLDDFWGAAGKLQDGQIMPWEISFKIPKGVNSITCFFSVIENSMPVYISDIIGQAK